MFAVVLFVGYCCNAPAIFV